MPPSTARACPTMKLAPALHNHNTAAATSSGSPSRPMGSAATKALMMSGSLFFVTLAAIGVLPMIPGHTALIRIPMPA